MATFDEKSIFERREEVNNNVEELEETLEEIEEDTEEDLDKEIEEAQIPDYLRSHHLRYKEYSLK